jgi:hypothetical protein
MSEVNIHASCVAIGRRGVLLLGKSGAGKSDLALRLIDQGATLVADDRSILFVEKGVLHARAPASIKGLLEIRGLGIVALPARAKVRIALAVRLGREDTCLPTQRFFRPPAAFNPQVPVHEIRLDARFASAPAKIRGALTGFSKGLFRDTFITK